MTGGLWKLSSLEGRRPPWYRPLVTGVHCSETSRTTLKIKNLLTWKLSRDWQVCMMLSVFLQFLGQLTEYWGSCILVCFRVYHVFQPWHLSASCGACRPGGKSDQPHWWEGRGKGEGVDRRGREGEPCVLSSVQGSSHLSCAGILEQCTLTLVWTLRYFLSTLSSMVAFVVSLWFLYQNNNVQAWIPSALSIQYLLAFYWVGKKCQACRYCIGVSLILGKTVSLFANLPGTTYFLW